MAALKKKSKKKDEGKTELSLKLGDVFEVGEDREKDFDLDMDAAVYTGQKGQAGTRRKDDGD